MSLSSEIAAGNEVYPNTNQPRMPKEENISVTQRMISACSGSLITSLVVTPFDVIRIRIQQQEILPQAQPCCQVHFPEHTLSPSPATLAAEVSASASTTKYCISKCTGIILDS